MANDLETSLRPDTFVSPILDEVGTPTAAAEPAKSASYKPLFRPVNRNQLDPDVDGSKTEALGAALSLPYTRDTVVELNLFGEVVSADDLVKLDGGAALIDLAKRKRSGQRTFLEAISTGPATDFVPYAGDIASMGIAIKNMKVVRDALRKVTDAGSFDALTLQEKVLTKLYMEDMERQGNQTFGGQVGSIVRQAPAFALEFLTTGAVAKLATAPVKVGLKKTATEVVERGVRNQLQRIATEKLGASGMTKAALSLADDIAKLGDDVFANAVKTGAAEGEAAALKAAALKAGEAYEFALKNPSRFRNFTEFLGEYGKRGLLDHADDVIRDLPPGVKGKLREAAGVAFVEAPVKGLMYSSFDFLVANPLITAAAGGTEAVTRTELGLHLTGDKDLMDNAKMLAFGSAWAEYASESSGRAFNALGGLVTDNLAGSVGRRVARSGLRARADFVEQGSVARRLYDYTVGSEAQLKQGLHGIRNEAVESAVNNAKPLVAGKTVAEVLADKDLTDKVMRDYLGFRDKSFLGYWVASKALDKNITPQAVTKLLENMGYDDILGEFMEERYSGFAEGLFGLDGQEHKSNLERIAHAFKSATPDIKQAGAEILAFSVPVVARAATSKAYEFLGQGTLGKLSRASEAIEALKATPGAILNFTGEPVKRVDIKKSDAESGSIASEFAAKAGKVDSKTIESLDIGVDSLMDAIPAYTAAKEDKLGFGVGVARSILGIANAIITGNPYMAFHNPMKALAGQNLGVSGEILLNSVHTTYKNLYKSELSRRASASASGVESGGADTVSEATFNDPDIVEAIKPALRTVTRFLLKEHLRTSGTVIVEDTDVDNYLDAKFKGLAVDGKVAGFTKEEFRKQFKDSLAGAAAGYMTMDVIDGRVHTTYRRPEAVAEDSSYASILQATEEFFAGQNIATHIDGATATDIRKMIEASSGTPMDVDMLTLARGDGMPKDSKEVEQARLALVMKMYPNPQLASLWDYYMGQAQRTASVLLAAHSGFLRPQFDIAGVPVEIRDAQGGYTLSATGEAGQLDGTEVYATLDEAVAAASAMKGAVQRKAQINFTPSNTVVMPYASMLLSGETGSRGYFMSNSTFDMTSNPFHPANKLTHAQAKAKVDEDIRLGTAYINRFRSPFANSEDEKMAKEAYDRALADTSNGQDTVDGYETVMRRAADAARVKRFGTPDKRGERSYIFEPAALSLGGTVYVSYRHMASHAAIIEDAMEVAIKRNPTIFQDPNNKSRNSPVVQRMMETIQPYLREVAESQDKSITEQTKKDARYLSDLLNPTKFEVEAISHVATAFVFMQGDSARLRYSGSRYYGTLGLIAKRVRGDTNTYDAFMSLVNRAVSGVPLMENSDVLTSMVRAFAPPELRDSDTAVRDAVESEKRATPVADVARAGVNLVVETKVALSGTPRSGFIAAYGSDAQKREQADYKREIERLRSSAEKGGRVYFDEELPFLLEQLRGARNEALKRAGQEILLTPEEEAIPAKSEAVEAAAEEALVLDTDDFLPTDEDIGASWAADIMESHPAFAIRQAAVWLETDPATAPDTRTNINKVFDVWQRKDPTLNDYNRQRFFEKVDMAGLFAKVSGKQNDITQTVEGAVAPENDIELDETDDSAETQNSVNEYDAADDAQSSGTDNSFNQDAVARNLENDAHVRIVRGMMHVNLPAAQRNDQEALRMLVEASASLYPAKGMKDPTSIASLFNEDAWTSGVLHPALVDEDAFAEWLDMDRPEKGNPLFDDLISAFRIIGLQGTFTAADKMKGAYVKSVFELIASVNADGGHVSVQFRPRTQSMSAELSTDLLRAAKSANASAEDLQAAISIIDAEASAGLIGRLTRLANAADLIFGKNNALSQALTKEKSRSLISAKVTVEKHSTYINQFVSYETKKIKAPAGLFAYRLANAARLIAAGDADGAVRQLMRGDAMDLGQADNRGGISYVMNDLASLIPVSSANRMGRGAGKTRAIDPAMSAGQKSFLLSPNFRDAFKKAGGKDAELAYAIRFGEWADGTPVFAALSGLRRVPVAEDGGFDDFDDFNTPAIVADSVDVANPSYDEVSDLAVLEYNAGKSPVVHVVVYNSEKTLERIVSIPRFAVPAFMGTEKPSYDELLRAVSALMRIQELSPKRGAHHMAAGAAAELQNAELALLLTEDKTAQENLHGMGYIGSAELAGYYRRQGFGSAAKVVLTESPASGQFAFFAKGQFILADEEPAEGALHPAQEELHLLARDYAYLSDKDSFKETALYYKTSDGSTVLDKLLNGDGEGDVSLPNGTVMKLSDLTSAIGAKVTQATLNGAPATIVSVKMGIRSQWASAPSKKAKPKFSDVPVNYVMDNPGMWDSMNAQTDVARALKSRTEKQDVAEVVDSLPDSLKNLIASGVDRRDPDIMKQLGPKLASAAAKAFKPVFYGLKYLNRNFNGARIVESDLGVPAMENGKPKVSDPYGGMSVLPGGLIHDEYMLSEQEAKELNAKKRMASTCCNLGGLTPRYGLRADATKLGVDITNHAGIREAIETRVLSLRTAELRSRAEGDPTIFLSAYKSLIEGVFTDINGVPLMPGQLMTFADLINDDGTFDRTSLYTVNEDGTGFVFLNGQSQISGRTPSRDGKRAEYAHRVAAPAEMMEADGSQTYTAVVYGKDKTLRTAQVPYPVGTMIPGSDAILMLTPFAKYIAGSDDDWDTSSSQRLPTDALGREYLGVKDAIALIKAAATDDDARAIARQAIAGLAAQGFRVAFAEHKVADIITTPVVATPVSKRYQKEKIPAKPMPKLDTVEAMDYARQNKEAGKSRGISVAIVGSLEAAIDVGLQFNTPVREPVLERPEGATSPFWVDGFKVGGLPLWTPARKEEFVRVATGIANSTFDDLKEALAARAGFRPEFLDLYLYLVYESGVTTRSEYEELHTAFMEWMNGPDGRAVTKAYRNELNPSRNGGTSYAKRIKDTIWAIRKLADEESADNPDPTLTKYLFRKFNHLPPAHQRTVAALVINRKDVKYGYLAVMPVVEALDRIRKITAVGNVLAYKKANLSSARNIEVFSGRIDTVVEMMNGKNRAEFNPAGRAAVSDAVRIASAMVSEASEALDGHAERSLEFLRATSAGYPSADAKKKAGGMSVDDAVLHSLGTRLPFEAAVLLTPRETGAKVNAIRKAFPKRETASFVAAVETILKDVYRAYAAMRVKPNAALDSLLVPSTHNRASRITMTGSDGTESSAGTLQAAMEAMRDWTEADKSLPVVSFNADGTSLRITPADLYWMLLQYCCLTQEKSVETGRATQSLLRAFYGNAVYKRVSDYQIAALSGLAFDKDPQRHLRFTDSLKTDANGLIIRKRQLLGIPDAMASGETLEWGTYETWAADNARKVAEGVVAAAAAEPTAPAGAAVALEVPEAPVVKTVEADVLARPAAQADTPMPVGGVKLPVTSSYTAKDQAKSDKATAFIGRGSPASSTAAYAAAWRPMANRGEYVAGDVVFVSAEGARTGRLDPDFEEIQKAVDAKATILTDDSANRSRAYNVGERQVAEYLGKAGYAETAPGVWTPAAAPQAAPAVNHTVESAAWKNAREYAKTVAGMTKASSARRLGEFAKYGLEEAGRMSEGTDTRAGVMAKTLTDMSSLPWMKGVPGAKETLAAAGNILRAMRYPEPSVFIGAVRAIGRTVASARIKDAMDPMVELFKLSGAAQSGDAGRIGKLTGEESADALAAPANLRVMMFAVASEASLSKGPLAAVPTKELAKDILGKLDVDVGSPDISASWAYTAADGSDIEAALSTLPKALANKVDIVNRLPDGFSMRGVSLAKKAWLAERGIDDPVMALWVERNEKQFGLKNWATKDDVEKSVTEQLSRRHDELHSAAVEADPEDDDLADAAAEWTDLAGDNLSSLSPTRAAFLDLLLDVPFAGLAKDREDKYVEYPSKVAVEALWDYMHRFPNERFNIAKKYAALKNEKVLSSVETRPAASGKGTWAVVPMADRLDSPSDFAMNVAKLRELSPPTWCTHDSLTEHYVSEYENHVLMVDGKAVAGIEVAPLRVDSLIRAVGMYTAQVDEARATASDATKEGIDNAEAELAAYVSHPPAFKYQEPHAEVAGYGAARVQHTDNPVRAPYGYEKYIPQGYHGYYIFAYRRLGGAAGTGPLEKAIPISDEQALALFNDELRTSGGLAYGPEWYAEYSKLHYKFETLLKAAERLRYAELRLAAAKEVLGRETTRVRHIHEVTSYANNGVASVDYLDDILEYIRANNWDENDEVGSISKAKAYKAQGKTDADIANLHGGHWAAEDADEPPIDDLIDTTDARLQEELTFDDPMGGQDTAYTSFQLPGKQYRVEYTYAGEITDYVEADDLGERRVTRDEYIAAFVRFRQERQESEETDRRIVDGDILPFSKGTQGIEGFYDASRDKAVLIAPNIASGARAREVVIHEITHRGLHSLAKTVGGQTELLKVLRSAKTELMKASGELVSKTGHKDLESLVRDYGFDMSTEAGEFKLLSELVARWSEKFASQPAESWWKRLLIGIADWIKRFTGVELDASGVDELVKGIVYRGGTAKYMLDTPRTVTGRVAQTRGLVPGTFEYGKFVREWHPYALEADRITRGTGNISAAMAQVPGNADPELTRRLHESLLRDHAKLITQTAEEAAERAELKDRAPVTKAAMWEQATGVVAYPEDMVDAETRADMAAMVDRAVGYTDGRKATYVQPELDLSRKPDINASVADDVIDLVRRADAEIQGLSFDKKVAAYMRQAHPDNPAAWQRKSVYPEESLAARMPLFMASDPDARKMLFGYIQDAVKEIGQIKNLGDSRRDMTVSLGMLFQPNSDYKVWKSVEHMNSSEFSELMKQLGNTEAGTLDRLLKLRKTAEGLDEADRKRVVADIDRAESLYLSALHLGRTAAVALRPRVNGAVNPLRAEIAAIESRITPPAGAEPIPEQGLDPVIDPDTGHPDPSDDFNVTFVDSDAWFYGTVFPDFRGADIRKILFDKEALSVVPQAFAVANRFDAYLGIDSDTGSLRKLTRGKGMGHHLADGGYAFDAATAADIDVFGRRKLIKEQVDILGGNAFSDDEFDLARWFGGAVYAYMGDGGMDARQATAGDVKFDLPWSESRDKLEALVSLAEAERRRGKTGAERPFAIHELLLRAQEYLPKDILPFAVEALKRAVHAGHLANGDYAAKSQAAYKYLRDSGYAVARENVTVGRDGARATNLYDVRLAIPVRVTDAVFQASTAKDKLIHNGRLATELTLEANAEPLREAFNKVDVSVRALGWVADGDARMFSDVGSPVPFFKGTGAYRYYARRLSKPMTPEYKDAVAKAYESLKDTFAKMKVTDRVSGERYITGEEASKSDRYQRMFGLLRDLHPQTFSDVTDAAAVWGVIASGRASGLGLNGESTAWDIAKAVYRASVAKLHDSAWLGGTVQAMDVTTAGLEAFNRAIGEAAAAQNENLGSMGATFSDIYKTTGALPQNLTAGEALALHARQVAEMTRYRMTLNQLLMTSDEDGMPLIYAKPGLNVNDDTVPDVVWGMLARWWAESGSDSQGRSVAYDSTLSGRENASRIFDEVTRGKEASGSEQQVAGGIRRYVLTNVEVPPGMETFSAVKAMKDRVGDDTKARMNAFGGGEAANVVRQVFAIAGYGRDDLRLAGMNRALSWSKSASVMASLFFPIATAFESPVAAVGFWSTTLGLTGTGANAARWLKDNAGWIAKAVGVNDVAKAPFMADILRVIGSNDPALVDLKVHAVLAGLSLADRAKNMVDTDRTIIAKDIAAVTGQVRAVMGSKAARSVKALLEGAMEHSSEFAFEYIINATKLAVFAQMNERLRQKAVAAGRWWDPVRDMKKWAGYINAEVGGIDPAMYPWMTPAMQRWLKALMFSWEWTLGAWEAGGGGVLTQKWFGHTTPAHVRKFMFGRWVRMYGSVMLGIPVAMQLLITGIAKAAGEGDDDDKWLTSNNEKGREGKDFDITPLLRMIANTHVIPGVKALPTWGDIKKRDIPVISALIPALTGQEGDKPTTRKRRYYMHLGKQGWEVAGWFENPTKSFLSKMSMPAQKILEGVLGITPSMGWETPFAEMGFWERWTSLDPDKSALVNLGSAFLPFSAMGVARTPEIGALAAVGPIGKGMSKTRAEKEMAKMFMEWGDAESYVAMHKGRRGAWTDLNSMAVEWLEALRLNGYPPETSLKNALAEARKPLYEKVHNALPAFKGGKADVRDLEAAARGLHRLNYVARNLSKSIKARDKSQNIKRVKELDAITDEVMRDAFSNPYGPKPDSRLKQSAAGGGDVRKLLAGDKMPKTVLGYKIVPPSEEDLAFFRENPESPGFFKRV